MLNVNVNVKKWEYKFGANNRNILYFKFNMAQGIFPVITFLSLSQCYAYHLIQNQWKNVWLCEFSHLLIHDYLEKGSISQKSVAKQKS